MSETNSRSFTKAFKLALIVRAELRGQSNTNRRIPRPFQGNAQKLRAAPRAADANRRAANASSAPGHHARKCK